MKTFIEILEKQKKINNKYTNKTNKFQIVGNADKVIGSYNNLKDAKKNINKIDISDSEFGQISIVEPNQTVTFKGSKPEYKKTKYDNIDIFKGKLN